MIIKNHKILIYIILGILLSSIWAFIMITKGFQLMYLVGLILSMIFTNVNLYLIHSKNTKKLLTDNTDERDIYVIMKSAHKTLQITNRILFLITVISIILYSILKEKLLIIIAITLTTVVMLIFTILFICNNYYEKYN